MPSGFTGVPVLDSAGSFSKMGSIPARHTELLLSWDQQLRGVMKQPEATDFLSLLTGSTQSGLTALSWLVTAFRSRRSRRGIDTFGCLSQFRRDWLFSSRTVCLLLCESTSGRFLRFLWPLTVNFPFSLTQLIPWGGTLPWLCSRFCVILVDCVSSSLLSCRMFENDCSSPGDVWMALSITLMGQGLTDCSETRVRSSLRASSSIFFSLSCSSLRDSRLPFKLCRFEPSFDVTSPL